MRRPFLALALMAGILAPCILTPSAASAQSVMVLGIRSVEGDDEFTRNLTGALRHAAAQVNSWDISDREVTLSQMALAHGCDEPDPTCLSAISQSLEVDRLLYGDVRRTSAGERFDFSVNLHFFNGQTGTIEHSVADTIPGIRRDIDDLREPARRWIAALSGAPRGGTLTVRVNVPGAEVLIDGVSVGTTDDDGYLQIESVEAGMRNVQIIALGHAAFRSTVSIEAYGEATFEAELEAGGGGGGEFPLDTVLGVGLLAVGVGLAAGWIYSGTRVLSINNSLEWQGDGTPEDRGIRGRYGNDVSDLCSVAGRPDVAPLCSEASTLEALQFVFAIGTAASAGVGLYFLVQGLTGGDSAEEQAVIITPSFGPDHAYVGALVSF